MRLMAYWYQFRSNISNYFRLKRKSTHQEEKSIYTQEIKQECERNLRLKCKSAALEIRYMSKFYHWPITTAKKSKENNALIYFNEKRKKHASFGKVKLKSNNNSKVSNKVVPINHAVTKKKLPL